MGFTKTGWFVIVSDNPKVPKSLAYRCDVCSVEYIFGENEVQPRAYCCKNWITPPKESFFSGPLPRIKATTPPLVLHHAQFEDHER